MWELPELVYLVKALTVVQAHFSLMTVLAQAVAAVKLL
jgi:hypothetical protein